jgi:hypothetical protein
MACRRSRRPPKSLREETDDLAMTIREGRWLCPHCEAENLGRAESCVACARAARERSLLPARQCPAVTDAALLRDAASGADWICSHCGGANPNSVDGARLTQCRHCGEARDKTDASTPVRSLGVGEAPSSAAEAAAPNERSGRRPRAKGRGPRRAAGELGRRSALAAPGASAPQSWRDSRSCSSRPSRSGPGPDTRGTGGRAQLDACHRR